MTAIIDPPELGQYDVLTKIGEGPRGPVWVVCTRPAADSLYLLEESIFATGEDESLRAFVDDLEHVARIQHRNLVAILELGISATGRYAVMPYLEGATLSELSDRHRAIRPPRLVLGAVIDALRGLHAAHSFRDGGVSQPLVHGALSPDKLWVQLDGTCRVAGFGHAQPPVQTKSPLRGTAPGYLAPEQLTGGAIDARTDVFSIGVVLWSSLTGKKLFHDRVEHMTMSNVLDRKIPRPSTIGLSPPPALDAIVLKALERDPAHRFQDAAEMAGALRDAARAAGCLASSDEVAEWIGQSFGAELAVRRRTLDELARQPAGSRAELSGSLRLVGGPSARRARSERELLSIEELARANLPARPGSPSAASLVAAPEPRTRKLLAVAALAALVVASVIGWRWWVARASIASTAGPAPTAAPATAGLEVKVLEVRTAHAAQVAPQIIAPVALPAPPPAPPPARTIEPPVRRPAPPPSRPAVTATRAAPAKRVARPAAPPAAASEPPADPPEVKPAEPRLEPAPTKPEPPRPTLESNPYLYNK